MTGGLTLLMHPTSFITLNVNWVCFVNGNGVISQKIVWPRREGDVDLSTQGRELGQLGETHEGN